MKNHENSTFYEEKKRYKEVKRRLQNQNGKEDLNGINNPFMFKEIEVIKQTTIHKNLMVDNCIGQEITKEDDINHFKEDEHTFINLNNNLNSDPFEILNILINFISKTIENLCKNKSINEMNLKNNKIETTTRNIENLIKLVHSSALLLKNTNNVLYSVLNKMDEVCKNAILNNPTLFGIIENILLKFCEVQDLLDFDQEDFTIETFFEMSKMIYIYKNKVNEIIKSEDIQINEDYKKQTFNFYYFETDKENDKNVLKEKMNEEEEAYTDWSTWIESFIVDKDNSLEENGEYKFEGNTQEMSVDTFEGNEENIMDKREINDKEKVHELNLAKRKALIRKDDKVKIKISLGIDPLESPSALLESSPLHTTSPQTLPSTFTDYNQHPCFTTQEMADILKLRTIKFENVHKKKNELGKIGEASFSEVFFSSEHVYKIIPLGNEEDQTPCDVFIREAFIQQCLKREKGICFLQEALYVRGKYPKRFLDAWDEFGQVENPRPCKYREDQLFGVIKMAKGPVPLEKVDFKKINLFRFIRRLSLILYDLEEKYEFEHRDLHWGNVLVGTQSIKIIDFTLSRLKCGLDKTENDRLESENSFDTFSKGKIVYNDLSKYEWLFEGNASVDEQFEIYRKMRDACKGDWASFNPSSNFYWVDYLARKIKTEIEKHRSLKEEESLVIYILKKTKTLKELLFTMKRSGFDEDKVYYNVFYK